MVLVRPRNPLNIGAAARAMSNFGIRRLRLVQPFEPSFHHAASAVGAADLLRDAQLYGSVAEAVADCTLVAGTTAVGERELLHPLHRLVEGAELLRAEAARAPVALLFGSEKTGLSNDELTHCHWLMHIPMQSHQVSMNLGQAVAVCLYELVRADSQPTANAPRMAATALQIEALTGVLMESLQISGYITKLGVHVAEEKVRRLLLRMSLGRRDTEYWLGMTRKILWKLKHPGQ